LQNVTPAVVGGSAVNCRPVEQPERRIITDRPCVRQIANPVVGRPLIPGCEGKCNSRTQLVERQQIVAVHGGIITVLYDSVKIHQQKKPPEPCKAQAARMDHFPRLTVSTDALFANSSNVIFPFPT